MAKVFFFTLVLVGLYLTTFVNYLLFHSLAELFSIVVASCVFMITWNSRSYIKNQYLLFIGIAYLFIALLDLLHTLSYKGMPIFTDYDYYANQLWIAARYMESLTLVAAFHVLKKRGHLSLEKILFFFSGITAVIIAAIFVWKIFPICFIEGQGLTLFKRISEYIICLILVWAMVLLHKNKEHFTPYIYKLLLAAMVCTIISELAFTFYISNYGFSNLVGHYFKLFSFYLIYKSIVETGIISPYDLVFRELDLTNKNLNREIEHRLTVEKDKEKLIKTLQKALEEVKTLSGLIPICAHCKKIRDDQGYWQQLETYIDAHSNAQLSHGICPDCMEKHYSDF